MRHRDPTDRLAEALEDFNDTIDRSSRAFIKEWKHHRPPVVPVLVSFTVNPGNKEVTMVTLPPIEIFSDQKQPMDLNPIAPGGTDVDESIQSVVTSSDPSQVEIVVVDAATNRFELLTPLAQGEATIHIEGAPGGPRMEVVEFLLRYKPFQEGTWNPTFGQAVSDTP